MKLPKWLIALVVGLAWLTALCSVELPEGVLIVLIGLGLVFGTIGLVRWFRELWK